MTARPTPAERAEAALQRAEDWQARYDAYTPRRRAPARTPERTPDADLIDQLIWVGRVVA